ncbi:MAG: hypothetical protein ABI162_07115 [Luteolibacter sp.]
MGIGSTGLNDFEPQPLASQPDYFHDAFPGGLPSTADAINKAGDSLARTKSIEIAQQNADSEATWRIGQLKDAEAQISLRERAFPLDQELKRAQVTAAGVGAEAARSEIAVRRNSLEEAKFQLEQRRFDADQAGPMAMALADAASDPNNPDTETKMLAVMAQAPKHAAASPMIREILDRYHAAKNMSVAAIGLKQDSDDMIKLGVKDKAALPSARTADDLAKFTNIYHESEYDPNATSRPYTSQELDQPPETPRSGSDTDVHARAIGAWATAKAQTEAMGQQFIDPESGGVTPVGKVHLNSISRSFQINALKKEADRNGLVIKSISFPPGGTPVAEYEGGAITSARRASTPQVQALQATQRTLSADYIAALKTNPKLAVEIKQQLDDVTAQVNAQVGIAPPSGSSPATVPTSQFSSPAALPSGASY